MSSDGITREPTVQAEAAMTAIAEEGFGCRSISASAGEAGANEESRNTVSSSAKLAVCPFRCEPRSATPLAVSTARRKLTQPIESRNQASTRSASSLGIRAEEPASRRKQSSMSRRCLSSNREAEEVAIKTPRAIPGVEGERACPASDSKNHDRDVRVRGE